MAILLAVASGLAYTGGEKLFEAYGDTEEKAQKRKALKEEYAKRRAYGILAEQEGMREHIRAAGQEGAPSQMDLQIIDLLSGGAAPTAGQGLDLQEIMGLGQRVAQGSQLPVDPVMRALGITSGVL